VGKCEFLDRRYFSCFSSHYPLLSLSLSSSLFLSISFRAFLGLPPDRAFSARTTSSFPLSHNADDNLLYHSRGESFLSIVEFASREEASRFSLLGSSPASSVSPRRLSVSILRTYSSSFRFILSLCRREISEECARRRAFENRKACTASRRFY